MQKVVLVNHQSPALNEEQMRSLKDVLSEIYQGECELSVCSSVGEAISEVYGGGHSHAEYAFVAFGKVGFNELQEVKDLAPCSETVWISPITNAYEFINDFSQTHSEDYWPDHMIVSNAEPKEFDSSRPVNLSKPESKSGTAELLDFSKRKVYLNEEFVESLVPIEEGKDFASFREKMQQQKQEERESVEANQDNLQSSGFWSSAKSVTQSPYSYAMVTAVATYGLCRSLLGQSNEIALAASMVLSTAVAYLSSAGENAAEQTKDHKPFSSS